MSTPFNQSADHLYYVIGVNPIPANTKNKTISVSWREWQDKSIPVEIHESRKKMGHYNIGIAILTGRIWRGKYEGKYLVGIDCDNKKAIDEICDSLGFKDINELAKWTWVEQHKDNLDKAHIYIISTKPFKNKGRNVNHSTSHSLNEIPAIEIKCERQTMFTAPSMHENGVHAYEILGTREPILCDDLESHIDKILKKYSIQYIQQQQDNENSVGSLPEPLIQIINSLEIDPNIQYRIPEGARHDIMLSFADSLLIKHRDHNRDKLKDFFIQVNTKICIPPLPESEVKTIWHDALRFSEEKIAKIRIINNDEDDTLNYNTPLLLPLEIGDKLLEQEIVQNFVYDIQANSISCDLNHKYDRKKVIIPINIKKWDDVRKTCQKLCEEKGISTDHILLLLDSLDINFESIKKYYYDNNKKYAVAEEQKKQRLQLIEEGTQFVMSKYRFLTIEESKDILFYDKDNGVYVYGGDIVIEKELDKKYGFKLKTADITEIKNYVIRKTYTKRETFDSNLDIVNLKNGLYNMRTGEFGLHTPDYYSINQKPFPYYPKARSKRFIKFLKEVLWPEDILTAIDIIAYTFIRSNLHELYFILIGTGANGKSVFTGLVTNLHGLKNVSNVTLKSLLTNKFALARLENKDVNIDTELSSTTISDMSILKRLSGTQSIMIEKKGVDPYDTFLHAKQIFNANLMPINLDNSDARYRREIPLSFPFQFEGTKEDSELLKKLSTEEELSGIFNIIAHVLKTRIIKTQRVHINQKTIKERREKSELTSNPVKSFLGKAVTKDSVDSDYEIKDDFYLAYMRYCKFHKLPIEQKETFGSILKNSPYKLKDGKKQKEGIRKTIWKGMRLKEKWRNDTIFLQQTLDGSNDDYDIDDEEDSGDGDSG